MLLGVEMSAEAEHYNKSLQDPAADEVPKFGEQEQSYLL